MTPRRRREGLAWSEESGYTLLEMLMVVAIIAILATFSVPPMMSAFNQARSSASQAELTLIVGALERYNAVKGVYPARLGDLVQGGYLRHVTFKNKFGFNYFYAVNDAASPVAFILADPGKKPSQQWALIRDDQPYKDGIIPEGADPFQSAYVWVRPTTGFRDLMLFPNRTGDAVAESTLSTWGRADLLTE